jgi:hypothetical protein
LRALLRRNWQEGRKTWRQTTAKLRFFVHYTLAGKRQPRVVFMHIPKTAGLSAARHILRRVGWTRTGRSANLAEMPWNLPVHQDTIEAANKAIFVYGHMSFASIDRLDNSRENYVFTFLREPRARLWSLYKHLNTHLVKIPLLPMHRSYALMVRCAELSADQFFLSSDPEILELTDNHVVRQLAGQMVEYPIADGDWPGLLERAKSNLSRIDFIGFQETFASDFPMLLKEIKIEQPREIPHANKALDEGPPQMRRDAVGEVELAIDRLVRWDSELYRFARERVRDHAVAGAELSGR